MIKHADIIDQFLMPIKHMIEPNPLTSDALTFYSQHQEAEFAGFN